MYCHTQIDLEIQDIHLLFEAPANAEGILEVVEAFTYDSGNLIKEMEWMMKGMSQ